LPLPFWPFRCSASGAGSSGPAASLPVTAAVLMLTTRLNPLWLLAAGGALGELGAL
jgi:hypothetical protein